MTAGQQDIWQGALSLRALAALAAVPATASLDPTLDPSFSSSSAQATNPPFTPSSNPCLTNSSAQDTMPLRGRILSSIQQLLPTMLASSVSNAHNQQMLVATLQTFRNLLGECKPNDAPVATAVTTDLLTGMEQLTKVCITACPLYAVCLWLVWVSSVSSMVVYLCHMHCWAEHGQKARPLDSLCTRHFAVYS